MLFKDKKIIVCGIVRNAANGLKRNIPVVNQITSWFGDWRVVIYENDSTDNTKEILRAWGATDKERVHVIIEDKDSSSVVPSISSMKGVNPFCSHKRIDRMANLRNEYIDYINAMNWDADYMMIIDLDVYNINADGVANSLHLMNEWDIVTANGYSTSPTLKRRYHDAYALCKYGCEDKVQTLQEIAAMREAYAEIGTEPVRVFSAFGGLAIYNFKKINGARYVVCENEDPQVEVRCEHYGFIKQIMKKHGDLKVCINPKMYVHYQKVTPQIVFNSFKRLILSFFNSLFANG